MMRGLGRGGSFPGSSSQGHQFSMVPSADIQRSVFNRSHGLKTAIDSGYLYPIFVDEVLPGDTFNLNMTVFARMATPIVPIMDNLFLDSFFFTLVMLDSFIPSILLSLFFLSFFHLFVHMSVKDRI